MALKRDWIGGGRSLVHLVWLAKRTDMPESDEEHLVVNPPFQRGLVWSLDQKQRWIETLLDDLPIPAIFVNTFSGHPTYGSREVVIDGQQRLRATAEFMKDEFWVRGEKWSEQTEEFHRVFGLNVVTPIVYTRFETEAECVELYLQLLLAGTAHTDSEIEKARVYLEDCRDLEKRAAEKPPVSHKKAAAKPVRCRSKGK